MTKDLEDLADRLDGDLTLASVMPGRRRNKSRPGRTATMSVRRKVDFVTRAILAGRPDSATSKACLEGLDGGEVKWGVWRRAKRNAALAMLLSDEWKREAVAYKRGTVAKASTLT